jgi:predicted nucleotidyltransferase
MLRDRYGTAVVLLCGSLATGDRREDSDLDIAMAGLSPQRYFAALADLMGLLGAPADLVRLEEALENLRERIAAEGKAL